MQRRASKDSRFLTREKWIANEEEVGLVAELGELYGKPPHTNPETACLRVGVRPFEGQEAEFGMHLSPAWVRVRPNLRESYRDAERACQFARIDRETRARTLRVQ